MTRAGRRRPIKRPNRRDDEIAIAGLTGAAVFLAGERGDRAAPVAELVARATQPDPDTGRSRVRAELLEEAAGCNLATWQHDAHGHWLGGDAALLLHTFGSVGYSVPTCRLCGADGPHFDRERNPFSARVQPRHL